MQSRNTFARRTFRRYFWVSTFLLALLTLAVGSTPAKASDTVEELSWFGDPWYTTNGTQIYAHGGQILQVGGTYYWIGEVDNSGGGFAGINCYSSPNLTNWTLVGDILPPQSSGDLTSNDLVERPKVLYNASTKQYVMWMHIWNTSGVGYATSPTVCGTYTYLGSSQPLGNDSFDIGSFQDTDGTAYLLSANWYYGLMVYKMSSDYLSPVNVVDGVSTWGDREAPAMFKANGIYYLLASYQTGWSSNDNQYSTATSIAGPWSPLEDFATPGTNTYNSQTTYVVPVTGSAGTTYMYMGDSWIAGNVGNSTYLWLPLEISGTSLSMANHPAWYLDLTTGAWSATSGTQPVTGSYKELVSENSGMCLSAVNTAEGTQLEQITCNAGSLQEWEVSSGYFITNKSTGYVVDVANQSTSTGALVDDWANNSGQNQQWTFTSNGSGYFTITNVNSGMCLDVASGSKSSGALIDQWTCNGGTNQLWKQK